MTMPAVGVLFELRQYIILNAQPATRKMSRAKLHQSYNSLYSPYTSDVNVSGAGRDMSRWLYNRCQTNITLEESDERYGTCLRGREPLFTPTS